MINMIDRILELGERLKADVKASNNANSQVFLRIWTRIENDLLEKEFDLTTMYHPACNYDSLFRNSLTDIGQCYLATDGRLPNAPDVAVQWLSISAEMGCLMGQMLLLQIDIEKGQSDYDPRWLQAYCRWDKINSKADDCKNDQRQQEFFQDSFAPTALSLGLRAAIGLQSEVLAKDVLAKVEALKIDNLQLTGLRWQAMALLPPSEVVDLRPTLTILKNITHGSRKSEDQALERFSPLLRPLPLQQWPDDFTGTDSLREEFPWMINVLDILDKEWALSQYTGHRTIKFRPLLLVGDPGLGKSRLMQRFGQLLGLPVVFMSLAGMADNQMLKGTARGWSSARAGYLVDALLEHRVANPLVCLDEIDKSGTSQHNGRVWDTLLSMLEPSTAGSVSDEFLLAPVNYSAFNWVATANDLSDIPEPLLSRFTVVEIKRPGPEHFDVIVSNIMKDIAHSLNVDIDALPTLDVEAVAMLRRGLYTPSASGFGIRRLQGQSSLRDLSVAIRELLQEEARAQLGTNVNNPQR